MGVDLGLQEFDLVFLLPDLGQKHFIYQIIQGMHHFLERGDQLPHFVCAAGKDSEVIISLLHLLHAGGEAFDRGDDDSREPEADKNDQDDADQDHAQHDRYKTALGEVAGEYDYCIIDNPPDLGMNVINAMVATHEIIIPVCLDAYSLDGLEELVEQINQVKALNRKARIAGVLITDYEKSDTSEAAESWLRAKSGCPVFSQKIRHSTKAKDATFYHQTPTRYSVRSGAAQDYKAFVAEYVQKFGNLAAGERG